MANLETFEGRALAYEQEQYDAAVLGFQRAIAVLEKRRETASDSNIRYAYGISIDALKAEVKAL